MLLSVVDGGWRRQVWLLRVQDLLRKDETRGQPAGILEFYNNGFGSIVFFVSPGSVYEADYAQTEVSRWISHRKCFQNSFLWLNGWFLTWDNTSCVGSIPATDKSEIVLASFKCHLMRLI